MASYSTNEFKGGLKIMLDGDPYSIVENEFVKPGKGQAFNRVKIRNLKTGRVIERTFKSGDSVEGADVLDVEMQYLYTDGEFWYFMDNTTFEQVNADAAALGDNAKWLKRAGYVPSYPMERISDTGITAKFCRIDDSRDRSWAEGGYFRWWWKAGHARNRRRGAGALVHPERGNDPCRYAQR